MTDSTKTVVWHWDGDAFGFIAPNIDPDGNGSGDYLNLRFAGQIADTETGVFYNLNRDYDQSAGRYLQSDPIGLDGGINIYSYVYNNPVNYFDRDGLTPEGAAAGGAIGSAVGGVIGGIVGAGGGILVAPGVGTVGGGLAGIGQGAVDGAIIGAAIGDALSDIAAMAAPGNVADTQIVGGYNEAASKARQCGGKAPDRCDWLEQNKNRYRPDQVKATQKAWGCRRSRHGR